MFVSYCLENKSSHRYRLVLSKRNDGLYAPYDLLYDSVICLFNNSWLMDWWAIFLERNASISRIKPEIGVCTSQLSTHKLDAVTTAYLLFRYHVIALHYIYVWCFTSKYLQRFVFVILLAEVTSTIVAQHEDHNLKLVVASFLSPHSDSFSPVSLFLYRLWYKNSFLT